MYITNEEDIEALRSVILEKKYFRNRGKETLSKCREFEINFAEYLGINHTLMVNSGSNALLCALLAIDLKPGDEVIVPSFAFIAVVSSVIHAGAIPVIVNIDDSLTIDPQEVRSKISAKTKAMIVVHMDGMPADMDSLLQIKNEFQLFLIEDVAQACGASYKGKKLGTLGDIGCFSFNVDKIISCGEGGAVAMNDRRLYERSLIIQDAACPFGPTFKEEFTITELFLGHSMRVSEISGALMILQLKRLDQILQTLKTTKDRYTTELTNAKIEFIKCFDSIGEAATNIHLKFSDIEQANKVRLELLKHNIVAVPNNIRPAHNVWQWIPLLNKQENISLNKFDYLKTIEIITTTLKISIPFDVPNHVVYECIDRIIEASKK